MKKLNLFDLIPDLSFDPLERDPDIIKGKLEREINKREEQINNEHSKEVRFDLLREQEFLKHYDELLFGSNGSEYPPSEIEGPDSEYYKQAEEKRKTDNELNADDRTITMSDAIDLFLNQNPEDYEEGKPVLYVFDGFGDGGAIIEEIRTPDGEYSGAMYDEMQEQLEDWDEEDDTETYEAFINTSDNPAEEMYQEAQKYCEGIDCQINYRRARKWFERAAELGHRLATFTLSELYMNGIGVRRDMDKARLLLEKMANSRDAFAMTALGMSYEVDDDDEKNNCYVKAREWYKKAAKLDEPLAMEKLGDLYFHGNGVEADFSEAKKWYVKAAERDNDVAMYKLGLMYEQGGGVERDYEEAKKWYEKSAESGNEDAMFTLAELYETQGGRKKDYIEARKWYQKAAEFGDFYAMKKIYEFDQEGLGLIKKGKKSRKMERENKED